MTNRSTQSISVACAETPHLLAVFALEANGPRPYEELTEFVVAKSSNALLDHAKVAQLPLPAEQELEFAPSAMNWVRNSSRSLLS